MPALLINTSRPPSPSTVLAAAATDESSVTSMSTARAQLGGAVSAFAIAATDVDGVAGRDESSGGLEAESFVRSSNQGRRHDYSFGLSLPTCGASAGAAGQAWLRTHLIGAVVGLHLLPNPVEAGRIRDRFAHGR